MPERRAGHRDQASDSEEVVTPFMQDVAPAFRPPAAHPCLDGGWRAGGPGTRCLIRPSGLEALEPIRRPGPDGRTERSEDQASPRPKAYS